MWAPSPWCHLPCWGCWDLSDLSHLDDIEEAVDIELWLLSNPQSGEGEGNWGDRGLWSLHCLLQSQPLVGRCGDDWWSEPPSPEASFMGGTSQMVKPEGLLGWWMLGWWIHMWMPWAPSPHLAIHDGLGNGHWPSWIVRGQLWGRLIFQPTYLPLWVGMQHL